MGDVVVTVVGGLVVTVVGDLVGMAVIAVADGSLAVPSVFWRECALCFLILR